MAAVLMWTGSSGANGPPSDSVCMRSLAKCHCQVVRVLAAWPGELLHATTTLDTTRLCATRCQEHHLCTEAVVENCFLMILQVCIVATGSIVALFECPDVVIT